MVVWFVWRRLNVGCLKKPTIEIIIYLGTKEMVVLSVQHGLVFSSSNKTADAFYMLPTRADVVNIDLFMHCGRLVLNVLFSCVFFSSLVCSFFPLFLTHVIHFDLLQSLIVFACARQRINIKFNREVFMALHYVLTLFEWIIIVYIKTTTFTHNSELALVFILDFYRVFCHFLLF